MKYVIRRTGRWKFTGSDGVHRFCYKKLSKPYGRVALDLEETLKLGTVPEWLKAWRAILMKDAKKGKVSSN